MSDLETQSPITDSNPLPSLVMPLEVSVPELTRYANLQPFAPSGWVTPLLIAASQEAKSSTATFSDDNLFVSWAITNQGLYDASSHFFVDLHLDGVPVERWTAMNLERDRSQLLQDWANLPFRARLTPGTHTLTLVVDPTNLIPEEDEGDNSYTTTFEWSPKPDVGTRRLVAPERLPNLMPFTPPGWDVPIQILPGEGALFDPPIHEELGILVAYKNTGLSSIGDFFQAHLYLDGVMVAKFGERGLIAREGVITPEWQGLTQVTNLKPGAHTLTLVVDPTHLVKETSEEDNTFSREFYWGPGLFFTDTHEPLAGEIQPARVTAFTPPGWEAPIVATNLRGQLRSPDPPLQMKPIYVHWALRNAGDLDLKDPFTVELRLDGVIVGSWPRQGLAAGEADFVLDWFLDIDEPLASRQHQLQLVVRQFSLETSFITTAILAEQALRWVSEKAPEEELLQYTPEELQKRFSALEQLLSTSSPALNGDSDVMAETVLAVADAIYYSLYERSLANEPLAIHLLNNEDYAQWVAIECRDTVEQIAVERQTQYQQNCARLEGFSGFTTSWRGQHRIVLRADRPPMQLLSTMAHEIGHFRQSITNPRLEDGNFSLDVRALREAQAYAYQIFFLRSLEGLTGRALLLYPKLEGYERFVQQRLSSLTREMESSEHARGQLLVWLALLTDPDLRETRNVLLENRTLTAEAALELYTRLVDFQIWEVTPYIAQRMKGFRTQVQAIEALALARLLPALPYWNEGSPYLRDTGLLLP